MPYIPQDRRADVLAEMREHGTHWTPKNAGDLNFAVTCFINNFIFENGCRYANLNEMIGALECCKLELTADWRHPMRIRFWKLTGRLRRRPPTGILMMS